MSLYNNRTRKLFLWLPLSITLIFLNALFLLTWFGEQANPTGTPTTTDPLEYHLEINAIFIAPNPMLLQTPSPSPSPSPKQIVVVSQNHINGNIVKLKYWNTSCLKHKKICILSPSANFTIFHIGKGNDATIYSVKFNTNNNNKSYVMKYKKQCNIDIFYQEYHVMNELYLYNKTSPDPLNMAFLDNKLPFYYYKNHSDISCFFFMEKLDHTFSFKKLQKIARFESKETIKKLLVLFDIDGGIISFLMKCFRQISSILAALIKLNTYNDDINSRNILINKYTHKCYLIDFGLTRNLSDTQLYRQNITVHHNTFTCLHYSCSPDLLQYKRNFNTDSIGLKQDKLKAIGYNALEYQLWSMFFHTFVSISINIMSSISVSEKLNELNYRFNMADNNNFHRTTFHFQKSFCQRHSIIALLKKHTNNLQDMYASNKEKQMFWSLMKMFDNDLMQVSKDKRNECLLQHFEVFDAYRLPQPSNNVVRHLRFDKEKYQLPNKYEKCVTNVLIHNENETCLLPNNISFSIDNIIGKGNHGIIYGTDMYDERGNYKYVMKYVDKWCVSLLNEYEWTYRFQMYLQKNYNLTQFPISTMHPQIPFYSLHSDGCFVFLSQIENTIPLHSLLFQGGNTKSIEIGDIMLFLLNCYNDIINVFDKMYEFDKSFHNSLHIGNILVNTLNHRCYLIDFGSLWNLQNADKRENGYTCFLYSCSPFTFYYLRTAQQREVFRNEYSKSHSHESIAMSDSVINEELDSYAMYGKRYEIISILFHIFVEYYCVENHHKICSKLQRLNHKIPLIYNKKTNQNETQFIQRWTQRYKMIKILRKKQYKYNISISSEFWNLLSIFDNDAIFINSSQH